MEVLITFVNIGVGFVSGLLVSELYWRRRIPIERPLLFVETDNPNEMSGLKFDLINKGMTRALNVQTSASDMQWMPNFEIIEPATRKFILNAHFNDEVVVEVSYLDVWGNKYLESWKVKGCSSWDESKVNWETLEYLEGGSSIKI